MHMARGMHQGTRNAPKHNGGAEEKETSGGHVELRRITRGMAPRSQWMAPRNKRDVTEHARKDTKEQESDAEKRKGNCTIRHRRSAEIIICTQFYKIIGAFITYLYPCIVFSWCNYTRFSF